jgi:DNA-binding MarR family transcriptional regulator
VSPDVGELFDDDRWTEFGLFHEAHRSLEALLAHEIPDGLDDDLTGLLLQLVRTPDEQLPMTHLARAMASPPSRITRLVDRAELDGLVERVPCSSDRRVSYAKLTDAGREAITLAAPVLLESLEQAYFTILSETERATMEAVMRRLRDGAQERLAGACDEPALPDAPRPAPNRHALS